MKIRYTYFECQPCGYGIFDEVKKTVVRYVETKRRAIIEILSLNRTEELAKNNLTELDERKIKKVNY